MKIIDQIRSIFDDAQAGKLESALLHACTAFDATSKRLYPSEPSGRRRFVRCIRDYYWLIEPMMGVGFNLVETKFENIIILKANKPPDFADIVYEVHRCSHAHGDEVIEDFELTPSSGPFISYWEMGPNKLRMPDRLVWALTAVVVFSRVNYRLRGSGGSFYLSWGNEKYPLTEWWGREQEIRQIAAGWNTVRVKLDGLKGMKDAADADTGDTTEHLFIMAPPAK